MDPITTKSTDDKFICDECKNENALSECNIGDVVECSFCGIEYKVLEKDDAGECILELLEEEK